MRVEDLKKIGERSGTSESAFEDEAEEGEERRRANNETAGKRNRIK